jgi:hypothetical protein
MYCVYNHKRLDTGEIFYVGIGEPSRPYSKFNRNNYWHNIVNKCGYEVEVTHGDLIWEEACAIERYLIAFYGRKDLGLGKLVNLTDGGEGAVGLIHSDESKIKMSEYKKSLFTSKENHPLYGLRGSASPNYGVKRTATARKNLSKTKVGSSNPMYGRRGKDCYRSRKVINTDTGIVYDSILDCAKDIGMSQKTLAKKLRGNSTNNTSIKYFINQITHDEKDRIVQPAAPKAG